MQKRTKSFSSEALLALRRQTGVGILDCKKALEEAGGDGAEAVALLRKKGVAKAASRAMRVALEGLVCALVNTEATRAVLVEINAETDFVARNKTFQTLVQQVGQAALILKGDLTVSTLLKASLPEKPDFTVAQALQETMASVGENLALARVASLNTSQGVIASYVHNAYAENLGRIGVLVSICHKDNNASDLGRKVALHIAASAPVAVDVESLDPTLIQREQQILTEQAIAAGKPKKLLSKIVEGRMAKFYGDVVLLKQPFVMTPDKTVDDILQGHAVEAFTRFALGEGGHT